MYGNSESDTGDDSEGPIAGWEEHQHEPQKCDYCYCEFCVCGRAGVPWQPKTQVEGRGYSGLPLFDEDDCEGTQVGRDPDDVDWDEYDRVHNQPWRHTHDDYVEADRKWITGYAPRVPVAQTKTCRICGGGQLHWSDAPYKLLEMNGTEHRCWSWLKL